MNNVWRDDSDDFLTVQTRPQKDILVVGRVYTDGVVMVNVYNEEQGAWIDRLPPMRLIDILVDAYDEYRINEDVVDRE